MSKSRPAAVIVLAAGEGTRMKSATPKVLHPILGRSMLAHVLTAAAGLAAEQTIVVVGHGRDAVTEHLHTLAPNALPVVQAEQRGTGHAVRLAMDSASDLTGTVVVVCGDTPLLTAETLIGLYNQHQQSDSAATVLSARAPDPTGYGRILRDSRGRVTSIVEDRDATPEQREVSEINAGIYAFEVSQLTRVLAELTVSNSQGEQYLTDVLGSLRSAGETVEAVTATDHFEVIGVNDRVQLAAAAHLMRERVNQRLMRDGVTIVDPLTTWIDVDVVVAPDTTLWPNTILSGATTVARGAEVGPGCVLHDTVVDEHAIVRQTTSHGAHIGAHAVVGPYTYLRPGTNLGPNTKAGAFVETKNARLGIGSKVPHLSYVGDADIGEGSNIGAATIFVNYDGVAKHRTSIGNHVRIGSDTMLVAPLSIGDGAYTAAGSVITEDVPAGAMAVARSRQRTIRGWVARRRAGSAAAAAAAAADRSEGSHDLNHPVDPSWEDGVPTNPEAAAAGESDREGHVE